jgi:hypothetical protein
MLYAVDTNRKETDPILRELLVYEEQQFFIN